MEVCGRVIPLQFLDCMKKAISFPSEVTSLYVCTHVHVSATVAGLGVFSYRLLIFVLGGVSSPGCIAYVCVRQGCRWCLFSCKRRFWSVSICSRNLYSYLCEGQLVQGHVGVNWS